MDRSESRRRMRVSEQSVVWRGSGLFRGAGGPWILLLTALACLPVAFLAEEVLLRVSGLAASASITATALLLTLGRARAQRASERAIRAAAQAALNDPDPVFCTDANGAILSQNPAAEDRFGPRLGQPVSRALTGIVPNASAVAFRQETALTRGSAASEAVVTRRGIVRITSFRVGNGTLWRIETGGETLTRPQAGSSLPMMVVSRNDTILSMNDAMRALLGERRRALSEVFETLPPQSGQRLRLKAAEGWIEVLVIELQAGDGRREIHTLPVDLLPL